MSEIKLTAAQRDKRLSEVMAELQRLDGFDEWTASQRARFHALDAEAQNLIDQGRRDELAAFRNGVTGYTTEDGAASGPSDSRDITPAAGLSIRDKRVQAMRRVGDPWAAESAVRAVNSSVSARDYALAAVECSGAEDAGKDRITRALDDPQGADPSILAQWARLSSDPAYMRAFSKLAVDPMNGHREFTADELRAFQAVQDARKPRYGQRAMSLTDSAGGYLIPFQLDPTVILTNAGAIHPIRQICRTVVATGDVWNGVSSTGITAGFAAEFTEASDNSPTLVQPSINVHKAQAFVPISIEAIEDASNIAETITMMFNDALFTLDASKLVTGSGTNEPVGIVTALDGTASEVAPTTVETFAAADVYKVQAALSPRWRLNAQWAANIATIHTIAQFETTNGALKFPGVSEIQSTLLGRPLWEASNMDGTFNAAVTADNFLLIYGDWSQYVIADRIGATIEFIPHLFHTSNNRPYGARGWYMHRRYGADSVVDDAFRVLNVATTA